MIDPIITMETAIIARLRYHNEAASEYRWPFSVKHIEGYGGQFESHEELAQAAQRAPALFVAYEGETGGGEHELYTSSLAWSVFCLARSYKPEELRRGGPGVVGLYQLIEAVRVSLVNQTLGLKMSPLDLAGIRPLWRGGPQGKGFSLAVLKFYATAVWEAPSNFELDEKICPAPAGLVEFNPGGRGILRAESWWRLADEYPVLDTQGGPEGAGPGPEPPLAPPPSRGPGG